MKRPRSLGKAGGSGGACAERVRARRSHVRVWGSRPTRARRRPTPGRRTTDTTTTDTTTTDTTTTTTTTTEPPGGEGCTPGYWKNHTEDWVGYTPGQTVGSVFANTGSLGSMTLLQALKNGGGSTLEDAKRLLDPPRGGGASELDASGRRLRVHDRPGDRVDERHAHEHRPRRDSRPEGPVRHREQPRLPVR